MKKLLAFWLCLLMLFSLVSCNKDDVPGPSAPSDERNKGLSSKTEEENEDFQKSNDPDDGSSPNQTSADYTSVLKMARMAIDHFGYVNQNPQALATELFGTESATEKDWFLKVMTSGYLFYPGRGEDDHESPHYKLSCGYAIKDLNGDGVDELVLLNDQYMIVAIFSIADGKPILLDSYIPRGSCWIDGHGLLHINGSGGAAYSTHQIYKIAMGGASLELIVEYGTNGADWVVDAYVEKYYQLVDGEKVDITKSEYQALDEQYGKYLGLYAGAEATKECAGLTFTSLYTEAEIAMEMYEAALNGGVKVVSHRMGECYLQNFLLDDFTPLAEAGELCYAILDMDGNGVNEMLIEARNNTVIFWYHDRMIYSCLFGMRAMYYLNTDGSYSWNDSSAEGHQYGESQMIFNDKEIFIRELWRIVNDGEPNAEYYIDGKRVANEEILKYFEGNPKTRVSLLPLEVTWQNRISKADAFRIAKEYWASLSPDENNYRIDLGIHSSAPDSVYVVWLSWWREGHLSTIDEIWIDKNTGETIIPSEPPSVG